MLICDDMSCLQQYDDQGCLTLHSPFMHAFHIAGAFQYEWSGTLLGIIIWLGLFPARRQILWRMSWRLPCLVSRVSCPVSRVPELSELKLNRDVGIWQRYCEQSARPSMPTRIPSQIAVDCKSDHWNCVPFFIHFVYIFSECTPFSCNGNAHAC